MPRLYQNQDNLKDLLAIQNATNETVELYIYGDIVHNSWCAWNEDQYPEAVKDFLKTANGRNVNVHINSGGGSVFAGIAIYNMLANYEGTVTVYVDGVAASIASVIAMAGDRTIMRTGSSLMVHKPMYCMLGSYNANELRKAATDLDAVQKAIMQVYERNIAEGASIDDVRSAVEAETWLTSEEACDMFAVEQDDSGLEAVACDSEFIAKYLGGFPQQYAQGKEPEKGEEDKVDRLKMKREVEVLEMEVKND